MYQARVSVRERDLAALSGRAREDFWPREDPRF
jgi:hypothetical protein